MISKKELKEINERHARAAAARQAAKFPYRAIRAIAIAGAVIAGGFWFYVLWVRS